MPVTRSTNQRGYDGRHKAERKRWTPLVESGQAVCATCSTALSPDAWDLGHNADRTAYIGPQCIPCNRGDGGRNGAAVVNARKQMTVRDW